MCERERDRGWLADHNLKTLKNLLLLITIMLIIIIIILVLVLIIMLIIIIISTVAEPNKIL